MKPSLQFRLSQHLTLTPQLQQSIRLLQLSTVELNQEIERILMENPALEREDTTRSTPRGGDEAPRSRRQRAAAAPSTARPSEAPAPASPTGRATSPPNWRGARDDDEDGDRNYAHRRHADAARPPAQQLSLTNLGARDRAAASRC